MGCCLQQLPLKPTIAHELQAEVAWQTSDVEVQASQIQAEQDKADMLAKHLQGCREELHGCVAGCASCSKSNMLGTVQLPKQLLCHRSHD